VWTCLLIVFVLMIPVLHADEIIDRVLASVDGQVITLSDVRMAQRFDLTEGAWSVASGDASGAADNGHRVTGGDRSATGNGQRATGGDRSAMGNGQRATGDEAVEPVLQRLIDRDLMLQEVEHYSPPEPDPPIIDRDLAAIRARFPTAGAYQRALTDSGIDEARLRSIVRDNLRLDAYLAQRFPPPPPPSESEVIEYYQTHPDEFSVGGSPQPFNEVRGGIVARLTVARRVTLIRDWLAGLRSRADLTITEAVPSPVSEVRIPLGRPKS
jgi:hypothetical protein